MLQASARDDVAGLLQGSDDRIIGVAFVSILFEHALAFETRRGFRHHAVGVDGERDFGLDAAITQLLLVRSPDVVVVRTVSGRGMDETGTGVVGDVIAVEQRNVEIVPKSGERMGAN